MKKFLLISSFIFFGVFFSFLFDASRVLAGDEGSEECSCNFKFTFTDDNGIVCSSPGAGLDYTDYERNFYNAENLSTLILEQTSFGSYCTDNDAANILDSEEFINFIDTISSGMGEDSGCSFSADNPADPYYEFSCTAVGLDGPREPLPQGDRLLTDSCSTNADCPNGFECDASTKTCTSIGPTAADSNYGLDKTALTAGLDKYGNSVPGIIGNIVATALSMISVIFFILMIYGGFLWMTAHGNDEQAKKAMNTIFAAIIGILIVMAAYAVTSFLFGSLGTG